MSSITTERFYKSLSFRNSSVQIFLKLYQGGFTRKERFVQYDLYDPYLVNLFIKIWKDRTHPIF